MTAALLYLSPVDAMPLCKKTMELVKQFSVLDDQVNWMVKAGVQVYGDVALLATKEEEILPEVMQLMTASDVASAKLPMAKISMEQ